MTRVKRGAVAKKRRKSILKKAKGFQGSHSNLFRIANQQVMKALKYKYVGRRNRKREFRTIWIRRINACSRYYKINYSQFIYNLKTNQILLNRKILSQLSILDVESFQQIATTSSVIKKTNS
jgi:large subunit ribosomal protein L20